MLVVLITSIANAQTTDFDFSCSSSEVRANRSALITDLEGTNGVTNIVVAYHSHDNYVYITTSKGRFYFASDDGNYTENTSQVGSGHLEAYSQGSFDTRLEAFKNFLDPNYAANAAIAQAIADIYIAAAPPTSFADVINDASAIANQNATIQEPFQSSRKNFISLFDNYGLTFNNIVTDTSNNFIADYDNTSFSNVPFPQGSGTVDTNAGWNAWMLDIAQAIWLYGHPEYVAAQALIAKRADRIAQIKVLSDASDNVIITDYINPTDGDTFIFNVLGDPNLQPEYSTTDYNSAIQGFAYLGDTEWADMKKDISDKIDEINDDVTERNIRINVLVQNSTTDVTVGARWSSLRGDLFDIDNGTTTVQIYANDYDLPLVVDGYTRLENLTHDEYSTLDAAIALKVGDLDPANAIYGFYPSEFNAAILQDKVDKAFDIAKANYDSDGVSGSFVKGIIHGSKITLRVAADNYPLELRPEMAHDANYEGWKTFIDRILYLVKTGDGSLNNDRNNWIDNLQYTNIGPAITVTNPSAGHDDWGIGFDGFQFIYGGYEEVPRNDTEANKVFNKDYNGSIGELTGIAYEALLVEITRIRELVIEADGLPQADGTNLIRKNNITSYTGTAAFNRNENEEWFVINGKNIWTTTNYGSICTPAPWLGVMDDDSFRYMYLIIRNELLKRDATTSNNTVYYNNLPENECN